MTTWSKIDKDIVNLKCSEIIHPGTNCATGAAIIFIKAVCGSSIFYLMHYPFEFLIDYAKTRGDPTRKRRNPKEYIRLFFRSVVYFGALEGFLACAMSCLFRKLIGKYTKLGTILIPGMIGGLSIFFQEERAKQLYSTYYTNFAMSFCWTMMEQSDTLRLGKLQMTLLFMFFSALISGLLKHVEHNGRRDYRFYWFFDPHSPSSDEGVCYHDDLCKNHILKSSKKYIATGLLLASVTLLFKKGIAISRNPVILLKALIQMDSYLPATFLGLYSLIYQGMRCFLFQKLKRNSSTVTDNILAGAIAGSAFAIQPSKTLLNMAVITFIQITARIACGKGLLPDWPYAELAYAIANGIIFDAAVLHSNHCPKMPYFIINTATLNFVKGIDERINLIKLKK